MSSAKAAECPDCGAVLRSPGAECRSCLLGLGFSSVAGEAEPGAEPEFKARKFAGYELIEEVARGGMGVVYRARQMSLGRIVALKLILSGQHATREFVHRFRAEAAAAAALQHPNIVAIHEVGLHEGDHFFSMDYVDGGNLEQRVGKAALPAHEAGRYLKSIAEAIHYAHEQGIIHRDLKPSNVLIDLATGEPCLTDFGLAKKIASENTLTVTGQILGSPNFMSPEQAAGASHEIGRRADVYGLGAILYFMLTARPPFQGDSLESVLYQVCHNEPVAPCLLNAAVPRDLETICLKCLEKEPARRYQSAGEVAAELVCFLNGEPIQARPRTRWERAWRWCGRNRTVSALGLAVAGLLLAVLIGAPIAAFRINNERQRKEQEAYAADMSLAQLDLRDNNLGRASVLVEKYAGLRPGPGDVRGWEWRYLWKLCQGDDKLTLDGHRNGVTCAVFSPDGKTIATAGYDSTVKRWDASTGSLLGILRGFNAPIESRALTFSADGRWLAAKGGTRVLIWDSRDWREPVQQFEAEPNRLGNLNDALVFSPDEQTIATRIAEGIGFWSVKNTNWAKVLPNPSAGTGEVVDHFGRVIDFSRDGALLAVSDWQRLQILAARSLVEITNLDRDASSETLHVYRVLSVAFHGDLLAVSYRDGLVSLYTTNQWLRLAEVQAHPSYTFGLAFSPDGETLATGGSDQVIGLWNIVRKTNSTQSVLLERRGVLRGHHQEMRALAFSPDGRFLVSASPDAAKVWELPAKHELTSLPRSVNPLAFSRDGKSLVTLGSDAKIRVWDVGARTVAGVSGPFEKARHNPRVAASLETGVLAIAVPNGMVEVMSMSSGKLERSFHTARGEAASCISLSPGAHWLAVATGSLRELSKDSSVEIFDLRSGQSELVLTNAAGPLAFSADGGSLALADKAGGLRIVDLKGGLVRRRIPLGLMTPASLAISPDGRLLAAGMEDSSIAIWDLPTGRRKHLLTSDRSGIVCVAFSADSKTLATTDPDNTVRLWHVATGRETLRFENFNPGNSVIQFSPDGNHLAIVGRLSGTRAGEIELLRAPTFEEITTAERLKAADRTTQ